MTLLFTFTQTLLRKMMFTIEKLMFKSTYPHSFVHFFIIFKIHMVNHTLYERLTYLLASFIKFNVIRTSLFLCHRSRVCCWRICENKEEKNLP